MDYLDILEGHEEVSVALAAFLVLLIGLSYRLKQEQVKRIELERENTCLQSNNALLEAEYLKYQLQPHTINNLLSKLMVISRTLNKGIESLSDTLEYILYGSKGSLASIEDELSFLRTYLKLNETLMPHITSASLDSSNVNQKSIYYKIACIPHLITVHFVENAFKHGDCKHEDFLRITASLTDNLFDFHVVNKISNSTVVKKPGIGLKNMKKRLEILKGEGFDIKYSCNETEYHARLIINFNDQ